VIYPNLRANAMRVSRLEPDGSTFTTRFQEDFLVSTDRWFRPVKSVVGPEGALYIADWYDYNISHSDPKDRSKWYLPSRDTGRIWRVVPEGMIPRAGTRLPLCRLTSQELVNLLDRPNAWYAREARRILMERRDPAVCPRLIAIVRDAQDDRMALEALWALHVSGGLTEDLSLELLGHRSEHVRAWTVRLLGDRRQVAPRIAQRFVELARHEPSPTVRSQLACTCKRLPGPVALPIVEQLLGRAEDVADPHIPLLVWWAIEDKAVSDRALVLSLVSSAEGWNRPIARAFVVERLARRYLAEGQADGSFACARLLELAPTAAERERLVGALEQQMEGQHFDRAPQALAAALKPMLEQGRPSSALIRLGLRLGLAGTDALALDRAADHRLAVNERAEFVRTLGELRRPDSRPVLLGLLTAGEPDAVRTAALLAVQRYDDPALAWAVIGQYPAMPPGLKATARDVLVSRPAWAAAMLDAVERGLMPAGDFTLDQIRRVVLHQEPSLTGRTEKLWGRVRPATSRQKQGRILAVSQILAQQRGDPNRGKPLVVKTCLNCHQLFGEGEKIGPDLTAADRQNLSVLLPNVIDPAAVIREGYQQYNVATTDGRVLSGLLAENSGGKVTVLDAKGVRTPLRDTEVDAITSSDASLMPEGLLDTFSDQELRDLFAYLRSEPGASHRVTDTRSSGR
jgi:putative heme-binding domain-containing protein